MALITPSLNQRSVLALVACDLSYATDGMLQTDITPLATLQDSNPESNLLPGSLAVSAGITIRNEQLNGKAEMALGDWVLSDKLYDPSTGFSALFFYSDERNEYLVALTGTNGPDGQDWYNNLNYSTTQWRGNEAAVRARIQLLATNNEQFATAHVTFTGQSLGGALAQFAAYDFAEQNPAFNRQNLSLLTFNGLGAYGGMRVLRGAFNTELLAGVETAHYVVYNDIVSRLGEGNFNAAGNTFLLDFRALPGQERALHFVDAHRIESGFYRGFEWGSISAVARDLGWASFSTAARAHQIDYLNVSESQRIAAAFGQLFNDSDHSTVESWARLIAGVVHGLRLVPQSELEQVTGEFIEHLRRAGPQPDSLLWGAASAMIPLALKTVASHPASIVASAYSLLFGLAWDVGEDLAEGQDSIRDRIARLIPAADYDFDLAQSIVREPDFAHSMFKALFGLKVVEGSFLKGLNLGYDASQVLGESFRGTDWLMPGLRYFAEAGRDAGMNVARVAVTLAKEVVALAKSMGASASGVVDEVVSGVSEFVVDVGKAIANAHQDFVTKIVNTVFDLRRALGFSEGKALLAEFESQLRTAEDLDVREAIDKAVEAVESAGQTVAISTHHPAINPFDDPGFDPDTAPQPQEEVKEGGIKRFTLSLPYEVREGGQRIAIAIEGTAAQNVRLLANGEEVLVNDGVYTVTVEEGRRELELGVWAQVDVVEDGELSLSATLVDAAGQATHQTHLEANVAFSARNDRVFDGAPDLAGDNSQFALIQGGVTGQRGLYIDFEGGNDIIWADAAEDRLIGGAGNDRLYGSFRTYFNAHDSDWLSGGSGDDWLLGHEGDDILEGDSGSDLLLGDLGDDFLFGNNKSDYATIFTVGGGDAEGDLLQGGAGRDLVVGSAGADDLSGGNDADLIMGGAGNDEIRGDTEFTPTHSFLIHGVTFPPEQPLAAGADVLYGNAGSDAIFGEGADDLLYGGEGSDTLTGGEGGDELYGGTGNDILIADSGSAGGGQGNDYLDGGEGDDQLRGQDGSDTLIGGRSSDKLEGGEGGDSYAFSAGDGKDTIVEQGVSGIDVLVLDDHTRSDITIAQLVNGSIRLIAANGDAITIAGASLGPFGIDRVQFADGTSLSGAELFAASVIDEETDISGPAWERFSGAHDTIVTAELPGGEDNDIVLVDAGPGDDTVHGGPTAVVFGNLGNDVLLGGRTLLGGEGNDFLSDASRLYGGAGDDELRGGDILAGGAGNDSLDGGEGADRYQFKPDEPGVDVVADTYGGLPPEELADWYYPSISIADWRSMLGEAETEERLTLEEAIAAGRLPPLPVIAANDYAALEPLYATGAIDMDTVELPEGLVLEDITAEVDDTESTLTLTWREGNSIRVMLAAATDPLGTGIERFRFADGTTLTLAEMLTWEGPLPVPPILGTAGDDSLFGTTDNDRILGLGGSDEILAGEGNDELSGDEGGDRLFGESGNDELIGGSGDDGLFGGPGDDTLAGGSDQDFLEGGEGDDEYAFSRGDGVDFVFEQGGSDSIRFMEGIDPGDVAVTSDPYGTLHLVLVGSDDRVVLTGWLNDDTARVETAVFVDGTTWDEAEIQDQVTSLPATGFGDVLIRTASNDTGNGLGGNDEIYGLAGDDVLEGDAGDDYLEGNAGNDILRGGEGADGPSDWQGNNLLDGGTGDDIIRADGAPDHSDGGSNFVVGGTGDDWIDSYADGNVIAFNAGDGHDTIYAAKAFTLSLGGGVVPADLALSQDGDDLLLSIEADDSIRFTRQFETDPQAWPQITLQMFGSVHFYDFNAVIAEFQAALAGNPLLTGFALDGVLQDHESGVSQTEALGGALAYQYGTAGSLNGMGDAAIRQVLDNDDFGSAQQSIEVPGGNRALVVVALLEDQAVLEDSAFTFMVPPETFADADVGDVLVYSASLANDAPLPSWLAFDAGTRTFSGTPANEDVRVITVKVTATDGEGASASDAFDISVTNTNDVPVVNVPIVDQSATVGVPFSLALPGNAFVDVDQGEIIAYSATLANGEPLPGWLDFNPAAATFTGTPVGGDGGNVLVRVTATDLAGAVAIDDFQLTVLGGAQGVHLVGTPANDELTGTEHGDVLEGLEGGDRLMGLGGDDQLIGGRGRDQLFGGDGQDMLFGDRARDTLYGGAGEDLLAGGRGNDRLEAGVGNDVYVHEKHGGHDVIAETGGTDSLLFGEGITPGMARLRRHHNDLVVDLSGPHGSVKVKEWFASDSGKVETIRFSDGTIWSVEEIRDRANGHSAWWHGDDHGHRHSDRSDSYHGKARSLHNGSDDDHSRRKGDPVAEYLAAYFGNKPRYDFEALAQDLEASAREGGETLTAGEIARRWQQVARFGAALSNEHDGNTYGAGYRLDLGLSAGLGIGSALSHARSTGVVREGANLRTFSGLEEGFHRLQP